MDAVRNNNNESNADNTGLSRRQVLAGAGGTGLLAAVAPSVLRAPAARAAARAGDGTPEQVHLTWGSDPATSVVVSWATPGEAIAPRVLLDGPGAGRRVIPARARPWMPCPGNHEIEFDNGPQGFTSYLTRYLLPDNGVPGFRGYWYSFRVGSAVFVSLEADDVVYQDAGPLVSGPAALTPAASTGNPAIPAGTSLYIRGYSRGAQTGWLRRTLAAARADRTVDWIIVQMHQDSCSSSATGNGSDLGIRQEWLPLFDEYQVDLVLCGHDHDYERSFPVRGYDSMVGKEVATGMPVQTRRPHPVTTTQADRFDTSQGTVHLILGGGGTSAPLDEYGVDTSDGLRQAKVFTKPNRPIPGSAAGTFTRAAADAVEDATWSAMRDPATGYGVAVFDLDPGEPGGETSITVSYYHAVGADPTNPNTGVPGTPNPNYTKFETFTLVRPRSDRSGGHPHETRNT